MPYLLACEGAVSRLEILTDAAVNLGPTAFCGHVFIFLGLDAQEANLPGRTLGICCTVPRPHQRRRVARLPRVLTGIQGCWSF